MWFPGKSQKKRGTIMPKFLSIEQHRQVSRRASAFAFFASILAFVLLVCIAWAAVAQVALAGQGDAGVVAAAQPFDWAAFALGLLPILIPAVIAILKITSWGRENAVALDETEQALGHVVGAVGAARRRDQPAASVLKIMDAKEDLTPREVVSRWKAAVKMWDPKNK